MTPDNLKAWRARLSLGEAGMAAYLGVPVTTYRKWENGTRKQDASTLRLFEVLQLIERMSECEGVHQALIEDALKTVEKRPPGARKRKAATQAPATPEKRAGEAVAPPWTHAADALPDWMKGGL